MQQAEPEATTPEVAPEIQVGDWVRVKVHKRRWLKPRWTVLKQVTEVTTHSVQVKEKAGAIWHHLTHCVPAQPPSRTLAEVRADLENTGGGSSIQAEFDPKSEKPTLTRMIDHTPIQDIKGGRRLIMWIER